MLKSIALATVVSASLMAHIVIYQDRALYSYQPQDSFIGFNNTIVAKDATKRLAIEKRSCLDSTKPYCKVPKEIASLEYANQSLTMQKRTFEQLLKSYNPNSSDAKVVNAYVQKLSDRIATLSKETTLNNQRIMQLNKRLYNSAKEPSYFVTLPKKEVELTFSGIYFNSHYQINIDTKRLEHTLEFSNRSGIDIKPTTATIYNTPLVGALPDRAFKERLIHTNKPVVYKKARLSAMADSMAKPTATATQLRTNAYTIENFSLKADEQNRRYTLKSEPIDITESIIYNPLYPHAYRRAKVKLNRAFEAYKSDVIYQGKLMLNLPIRRDKEAIYLNIGTDFDLHCSKDKVEKMQEQKGLFTKEHEQKERFRLTLTNLSNMDKVVDIIEAIPLSEQKEIVVSFEGIYKVIGDKKLKIPYSFDKKSGKLQLQVTIDAKSSSQFEYAYTIVYPRGMQIRY